jgi:hypothetical protein
MAYLTDRGRTHNDLLAYSAARLLDLSRRAPDAGRGSVGPALDLVAKIFAREPQWLRQIVSMFRARMARERNSRLFKRRAPQLLRSMIPTEPMFAASDDPNEVESRPLYFQLPGFIRASGGLIKPPPMSEASPGKFSHHVFVPDHLVPWLI